LVSHSRSGSQPVTGAPPPPGTLYPPIGNLAKLSLAKISGSDRVFWVFLLLKKEKSFTSM